MLDYNKSYLIMNIGLAVVIIIGIIFALIKISWLAYIGIIVMLASLIQAFIFYRCPNCSESFNIRGKKPKHCPECGYKLDD